MSMQRRESEPVDDHRGLHLATPGNPAHFPIRNTARIQIHLCSAGEEISLKPEAPIHDPQGVACFGND